MKYISKRKKTNKNLKLEYLKIENPTFDNIFTFIKENSNTKFNESIDVNVGIYNKFNIKTIIKGSTFLPHSIGNIKKIAFFTNNIDDEHVLREFECDYYEYSKILNMIKNNEIKFDLLFCTESSFKELLKFSSILGPKGLLPNIKNGTIINNINLTTKKLIHDTKHNLILFKSDKNSFVNAKIGYCDFSVINLFNNLKVLIDDIKKYSSKLIKSNIIKSICVSTTMGVGIKISKKLIDKLN